MDRQRIIKFQDELVVNGVTFREEYESIFRHGNEKPLEALALNYTRWIGDKMHAVKFDSEAYEVSIETNMSDDEIEDFERQREENWLPSALLEHLKSDLGINDNVANDNTDSDDDSENATNSEEEDHTLNEINNRNPLPTSSEP